MFLHRGAYKMKKINSIGYAHKILGLAALFLAGIPAFCYLLLCLFHIGVFSVIMRISFGIGLLILVFFAVLLTIELNQDKAINKKHIALKKTKLIIGNGVYECQSCGNRQVRAEDKECLVCGICFYQGK